MNTGAGVLGTNGAHERCNDVRRLNADEVEALVWDEVSAILGEPERLMSLARDYLGLRGQQMEVEKDQLAAAETKITALERALENAYTEGFKPGSMLAHSRLRRPHSARNSKLYDATARNSKRGPPTLRQRASA